jgi:hypothetical protein
MNTGSPLGTGNKQRLVPLTALRDFAIDTPVTGKAHLLKGNARYSSNH